MSYTEKELDRIYDRTSGKCHLCRKKLSFSNYGCFGEKGAWEVEHSVPQARGGTDHGRNLYAACISCNRSKRDGSTRSVRAANGVERAPRSKNAARGERTANTIAGAGIGALIGLILGPPGVALGGVIGGAIGNSIDPT